MGKQRTAIVTTLLTLLGLAGLFGLRLAGLYSHQALALVLLLGCGWAIASRVWLARTGRLHPGWLRGLRGRENRPYLLQAAGRASFWTLAAAACLAIFPRTADLTALIAVVIGISLLRIAASFVVPERLNPGPTIVMAAGALILAFDLGRAFVGGPVAEVRIAPPFEGEWVVLQGGPSPLQSHHLVAYNQHFALDLVRLKDGRIFADGDGNTAAHSWEEPLKSPGDGTVVVARDGMEDSDGVNFVTELEDATGNVVVIELDSGLFVLLAHLRQGTLRVSEGDRMRAGDPLALVGNSGNTTMPHLHLQVQTHPDLWNPDNRSVPFAFGPDGRVLARNDRIGAPADPVSDAREGPRNRHLLIVIDGLRPDYVAPAQMPNLHALGERGVVFTDHHAVYPTVTRVNAASISTGAYPETHGLMGNAVFFPNVDPAGFLNTADRSDLLRIEQAEAGRLLTAPTLGERLQEAGLRMLVVSAGSAGSSFLLNHRVAGGGIIHHEYALPEALGHAVRERLGPPPPGAIPQHERNRYIVDSFLEVGLDHVDPAVTVIWLTEPDTTAHSLGIGHPTSMEAIRGVDEELERLQRRLQAAGRLDEFNIWVTSDHGFSTHTGGVDIEALLAPFAARQPDGSPRIVTGGGAIYVRDGDRATIAHIVEALQAAARVGAIFTRDGSAPGTLPLDLARLDHPRAADILYSPAWTDAANEHGYRGTSASGGTAGHGSTSPYDILGVLIAAGPDLCSGITVGLPTSNVDLAPTILAVLGLEAPETMTGRVLTEALKDRSSAPAERRSNEVTAETPDGIYRVIAHRSVVAGYRYLDAATAERR